MTDSTTTANTRWQKPIDVSDLGVVFGVGVVEKLMPAMAEIPDDFTNANNRSKWTKLQRDWFYRGLKDVTWSPKPGVDLAAALRHLKAIQGSFEPRHEHKEAAVSYLASLWFDDVTYEVAK